MWDASWGLAYLIAVALMCSGIAVGRRSSSWEGERIGWLIGAIGILTLIASAARG